MSSVHKDERAEDAPKGRKLGKQVFRFSIVSYSAFLVDFVLLALLTSGFGVPVLISNAIAFTTGTVYSYLLSMRYVFKHKEELKRRREFALFFIFSCVGLGISELMMWIFEGLFGIPYLIAKMVAALVGAFWNFWSRKHYLDAD